MKCILNLAYVGVLRIYFKFANLGKVAYFSVWRFFESGMHFMLLGHFLFGVLCALKSARKASLIHITVFRIKILTFSQTSNIFSKLCN